MRAPSLSSPRDDIDAALGQIDELRHHVSTLLTTQRELSTLLVAAQTRNGEQMKVLVAVRALIDARDAAGALESLQDILLNVIGADDFTIYALEPSEERLVPIAGTSTHPYAPDKVSLGEGWLGTVVKSGQSFVRHPNDPRRRHGDVEAVAPLRVLDRVVGAIVIGGLLPHRGPLDLCDREILEVLGAYAATAIIAADRRNAWHALPDALR